MVPQIVTSMHDIDSMDKIMEGILSLIILMFHDCNEITEF